MQGDIDPLIPLHQAEVFYDALRHAGVDVTFIKVKNGNHGFSGPNQFPTTERIQQRVLEFFDKYLKG